MVMDNLSPLINLGAIGAVLWWFLTQTNPRLDAVQRELRDMGNQVQRSLDRLTRAQMLTLISRTDVPDAIKREAREILKEVGHEVQARAEDKT